MGYFIAVTGIENVNSNIFMKSYTTDNIILSITSVAKFGIYYSEILEFVIISIITNIEISIITNIEISIITNIEIKILFSVSIDNSIVI